MFKSHATANVSDLLLVPSLQETILNCIRTIFSLEDVRYHDKESLAEDINRVFLKTVESMKHELQENQFQHDKDSSVVVNTVKGSVA